MTDSDGSVTLKETISTFKKRIQKYNELAARKKIQSTLVNNFYELGYSEAIKDMSEEVLDFLKELEVHIKSDNSSAYLEPKKEVSTSIIELPITRVVFVDKSGRVLDKRGTYDFSIQDEGRTLKIFQKEKT